MIRPLDFSESLHALFQTQKDVLLAYLFGSHARNKSTALSDIDIAILLREALNEDQFFEARLRIMDDVAHRLHFNDVDVLILNHAPLALRYRALRDGKILFCRDEKARVHFATETTLAYLDFKPVIDLFQRATLERARKGELLNGYDPHRGAIERYFRLRERLEKTSGA